MPESVRGRKLSHIRIASSKQVEPEDLTTGMGDILLVHDALPRLDYDDVSIKTKFLGHAFQAPVIVTGITGGHKDVAGINASIAEAVEEAGVGMGVGSQRVALRDDSLHGTFSVVRKRAPTAFIMANLGIPQLRGNLRSLAERVVNMVEADALAIHLNAAQEVVQPGGEVKFRRGFEALRKVSESIDVPLIVKETGCGISREVALRLVDAGVSAIDVSGAGGTSWVMVEYFRAEEGGSAPQQRLGKLFSSWGIQTAVSVCEVRSVCSLPIIVSGGIRNGLDIVKGVALGGNMGGMALPVLKAAMSGGTKAVKRYLAELMMDIRTAMFLVNARNVEELSEVDVVLIGQTAEWLTRRGVDTSEFASRRLRRMTRTRRLKGA